MAGRIARWLIGGAVVAVVATGCAQAPKNYAVVDGDAIPVSEVMETAQHISNELGGPVSASRVNEAGTRAVLVKIAEDIAEAENLNYTHSEVSEYAERQFGVEYTGASAEIKPYIEDTAFLGLVLEEVGQEGLMQAISEADVVVNPRYGSWSPQTLIDPAGGGLSLRAPAVAPSATS